MTPKGHPELAGIGIEYSWGKSNMHFRIHNDLNPKTFHSQVLYSMSTHVLDLTRRKKFARRARDYMRAYAARRSKFAEVEKQCRVFKTHRNPCTDARWTSTPHSFETHRKHYTR